MRPSNKWNFPNGDFGDGYYEFVGFSFLKTLLYLAISKAQQISPWEDTKSPSGFNLQVSSQKQAASDSAGSQ